MNSANREQKYTKETEHNYNATVLLFNMYILLFWRLPKTYGFYCS